MIGLLMKNVFEIPGMEVILALLQVLPHDLGGSSEENRRILSTRPETRSWFFRHKNYTSDRLSRLAVYFPGPIRPCIDGAV